MPTRAPRAALLRGLAVLAVLLPPLSVLSTLTASAEDDPGIVIELDRHGYAVEVRDERSGERGPLLAVAVGSPSNPTPDGRFRVGWVILSPGWHPSPGALAAGAQPEPPSLSSPMGVAKIPFAAGGSIALHGGGDPRLIGQPVSGGCVRASDADLLRLIAWLDLRGALGAPERRADGEIHRPFRRRTHVVVR